MTTFLFGAIASGVMSLTLAAGSPAIAHIHGKIVQIDRAHGIFLIHHDPFPMMPMAMTMQVQPVHAADLARLHVGEYVDATIDTSIVPWPGTNIHPAPAVEKIP
jgi:Cu/Ag efflux protein CusF